MKIKILSEPDNTFASGGDIHIKKSHEGLFTEKAQRAGMGVQQFARHVLANRENYSAETVKQATFAHNAVGFKHALGGNLFAEGSYMNDPYLGYDPVTDSYKFNGQRISQEVADFLSKLTGNTGYGGGRTGGAGASERWEESTEPERYEVQDTIDTNAIFVQDFNDAFAKARRAGKKTFEFNGRIYTTEKGNDPRSTEAGKKRLRTVTVPVDRKIKTREAKKGEKGTRKEVVIPVGTDSYNVFAEGGMTMGGYHTNGADWEAPGNLRVVGTGGTHEENANEGVPQGVDQEGVPNLVEENEVVYNDYVFSNRLRVPKRRKGKEKEISDLSWEERILKPYEGMAYAEAAQKAYKRASERPMDQTEKRGLEVVLGVLAGSQEKERAKQEYTDAAAEIENMSGQEFVQRQEMERMVAEQAQQQQMQQMQQAQQMQGQDMAMQEQSAQEMPQEQQMSPEDAMMQEQMAQQAMQEQAMQQAQVAALGGNIHAYGGNFYDNSGQVDLARYQQIFQQIQQYAQQGIQQNQGNPDVLAQMQQLYQATQQVKTNQQMVQFVEQFLAMQQAQQEQQAKAYAQQQYVEPQEQEYYARGGQLDNPVKKNLFWDGGNISINGQDYNIEYKDDNTVTIDGQVINSDNRLYQALLGLRNSGISQTEAINILSPYLKSKSHLSQFVLDGTDSGQVGAAASSSSAGLIDKQKEDAQKQLNRYYRKKGVNPSKLTGVAVAQYQKDLQTMYVGMLDKDYDFSKDTNLAINHERLTPENKKDNASLYADYADYLDLVSRGAKPVILENGKVLWDEVQGFNKIDDSAEDFYTNPSNLIEGNGIYNYIPASQGTSNSQFNDEASLQQYYRDAITKEFKDIKGGGYSDDRLSSYWLNGAQLRNWVHKLSSSADLKDKELAEIVKANWGNAETEWGLDQTWELKNNLTDNGSVVESPSYSSLPQVSRVRLQNDGLPGIEHVPYKAALPVTPASMDRWFYVGPDNTKHLIHRPTGNYKELRTENSVVNGINSLDHYVDGTNLNLKFTDTPFGALNVTDLDDIDTDAWQDIQGTAPHKSDLSKLGLGVTGTPSWVTRKKSTSGDQPKFEYPSMWPWWMAMGLNAGTTLYNALTPIDYSNANALIEASKNAGMYQPVSFNPIGQYLTYRPLDRNWESNKLLAAMAGGRRVLTDLSGGNRSQAAANIIGADNNLVAQLGALDRQAAEANRGHEAQVAEFNRGTDQFNSEGILKADLANQETASKAAEAQLKGLAKGYEMRELFADNKANAINAGITGIANALYNYYNQDHTNRLVKWNIDTGNVGNVKTKDSITAYGGNIRRKKKGLTL